MSLTRVILVAVQAISNQLACTPPNPTSQKQRYHTDELYILQIAPLIFKIHQSILWLCTFFEISLYLTTLFLPNNTTLPLLTCPLSPTTPPPSLTSSPLFTLGVIAVLLGTYLRLDCYAALGPLFTFDLTVHPAHTLVTSRFYAYVRHPAYTGSLLLIAGLATSHFSPGSWLTTCGPLRALPPFAAPAIGLSWWLWTFCVGVSRARAEDRQMQTLFGKEWSEYAGNVGWWFFPGLL